MKRILCICICLFLSAALAAPAAADSLPTLAEALRGGIPNGRIEIRDEFSDYSLYNGNWENWGSSIKIIILERHSPEKEFTKKIEYPPFSDNVGFPDDFEGVDVGETHVYLRGDLMNRLPSVLRANSLSEATYIFMAEDIYYLSSTLLMYDYEERNNEEPPEFETTEEMVAYFMAHQPVIASITYYPTFGSYAFVSMYDIKTKKTSLYSAKESPGRIFARNPEAAQLWADMADMQNLLGVLEAMKNTDIGNVVAEIDTWDFVDEATRRQWKSDVMAQKKSDVYKAIDDRFWNMAEDLKNLDDSETNRKNYDLIIGERNALALTQYVRYCDYSGFAHSMDDIEAMKEYISEPDWDFLEETLEEIIRVLNS